MPRPRIAVAGLVFFIAVAVLADDTTRRTEAQPVDAAIVNAAAEQSGMQVAIDPVTGQLRAPNAEEARILTAALRLTLNDSSDGLQGVRLANGAEMLPLEGRYMNVFIALMHPEGGLQTECVSNADQAAAVVAAAVKAPVVVDRKKE